MNKMTNKHNLLKISIILIAFVAITGCQNIFNQTVEDSEQTAAKYGKIAVTVDMSNLPQNACFSQDNSTQNARSAMPSTFDGTEYVFAGTVHDSSTTVSADMLKIAESATPDATNKKLTVAIPFKISTSARENYTLSIYAFKSGTTSISESEFTGAIFYGTTTVTIPANAITVSSDGNVILTPKTIPVTINGKISLKISVPKNYTLSAECKTSGHSSSSCGFAFTKDTELSDVSTSSDFYTFSESDTSTGIASGEHDVTFTVEKPMGTTPETYTSVYVWTETITVYPYLTTDRWTSGNVDANGTRVISNSQFYSTFYVSGTSPKVFDASGNDSTGDGSLAKPYATVQKAIDRIKAINDGTTKYTIYIDGTVNDSNITLDENFNLLIQGLTASYDDNIIQSSKSGEYIFGINNGANVTFKNLSITGANVTDGTMYGGAISAAANTNIVFDNVHAYNNKAAYGGVIYTDGNVTLQNGTVFGDKTQTTTATSSDYSNYATYNSGAIRVGGGTLTIKSGCYIAYNYVTGDGGTGDGGGITVQGAGTVIIENGAFIQYNAITGNGGGISFGNTNNTATISGNIIGNSASKTGGGIYISGGTVTIKDGEISKNTASGNGGGVYVNGGTFEMSGGTIGGNTTSGSGGGVHVASSGTFTMNGGEISKNTASGNGGGVFVNSGTFTMTGGTIGSGNMASGGGGVDVHGGMFEMSGGTIGGNMASGGGGVHVASSGTFKMSGGEISSNTATTDGGGIYNNGTFNISGAAYIPAGDDGKNDVYLNSGKYITITSDLTGTTTVATITPASYTVGTQVLADNPSGSLVSANYTKFAVTPNGSTNYTITSEGKLQTNP